MGELVLAAKVTHVPSMFLSELDGPYKDCRKSAIEGLREIGRRIEALGADTVVVLDTHWLVNAGYHVNACERFQGGWFCLRRFGVRTNFQASHHKVH